MNAEPPKSLVQTLMNNYDTAMSPEAGGIDLRSVFASAAGIEATDSKWKASLKASDDIINRLVLNKSSLGHATAKRLYMINAQTDLSAIIKDHIIKPDEFVFAMAQTGHERLADNPYGIDEKIFVEENHPDAFRRARDCLEHYGFDPECHPGAVTGIAALDVIGTKDLEASINGPITQSAEKQSTAYCASITPKQ